MKRLKQQLYSDPIPVDLLIDIFSRVTGESIERFRCVSKFWGYILRRHDFTELFFTKSSTRPRLFFTVRTDDDKLFFYSSPQPQNPDDNSTLVATRYHTSFPEYFPSSFCSPVCGLALLQVFDRKVRVICNPITGEYLTLPKLLLKNKTLPEVKAKGKSNYTARERIARVFLGYDPINKQFKVLCMTSSLDERPNTHQVLTMESGKRLWRKIECKFHFIENIRVCDGICINGVLYIGAKMGRSSVIVCFDVMSEKFGFINLDKDLVVNYFRFNHCGCLALFNYKGKLGIRQITDKDRELVLWVIEDAQSHKWFKQTYELPPLADLSNFHFVGMTGTGEIVWSSYNRFCVSLYNLERKTITRVNIQGLEEFGHRVIHTFLDYVENLKFM